MKMWIDADAAPRDVKEVVFRAAKRLAIETVFVANAPTAIPANATTVSSIVVRHGANIADQYIASRSTAGDVAVTADIPLAAILVDKGVHVIDPRGDIYDANNIKSRLATRDFFESVRSAGIQTPGSNPYSGQDKKAFADSLDRILARVIAAEKRQQQSDACLPIDP
jgi:uncharacterized protein YaiI (UPF0178 family)